jgi:hypothetical protein
MKIKLTTKLLWLSVLLGSLSLYAENDEFDEDNNDFFNEENQQSNEELNQEENSQDEYNQDNNEEEEQENQQNEEGSNNFENKEEEEQENQQNNEEEEQENQQNNEDFNQEENQQNNEELNQEENLQDEEPLVNEEVIRTSEQSYSSSYSDRKVFYILRKETPSFNSASSDDKNKLTYEKGEIVVGIERDGWLEMVAGKAYLKSEDISSSPVSRARETIIK